MVQSLDRKCAPTSTQTRVQMRFLSLPHLWLLAVVPMFAHSPRPATNP
jgi:hypothetical protein